MNWISVKEQPAPLNEPMLITDGKHILCCHFECFNIQKGTLECIAHNVNAHEDLPFMQYGTYEWPRKTTHWMPLPKPPCV